MKLIIMIIFRSLLKRRMRSILTLFGIILGVASIYSINFTNQNAYRSIDKIFEGTSGRVNLEIRRSADIGGIPISLLDKTSAVAGVKNAVPILKIPAALPGESQSEIDLNFFGTSAGGLILYGIDPVTDPLVRDYKITKGIFIDSSSEEIQVVLVENFAIEQSIEVGETIKLLTEFGLTDVVVVGFIAKEGAGLTNSGKFGVLSIKYAQQISKRPDEADQIDIVSDSGNSDPAFLENLRSSLLAELGANYRVVSPSNQGERMSRMLSGYQIGLNFMAGISLFVGAFLIFNTFSMTVVERTRELGLLRSVGMTRLQITSLVLYEGLFMGFAGSLAGAGFGILMSQGLIGLMSQILGQSLDSGDVALDILSGSILIGICVTVMAALLPAYQAGRISPLEALRLRGKQDNSWISKYGFIVGVLLLAASSGILILNPFPYDVQFRLGSVTVFALFFGVMLIIPATLKFWQYISSIPLRIIFGKLSDIGIRNLERAKKRTMITCAALLIGVSMIVVTQGMTGSFTADLYDWMDAYICGDIFVSAAVPITWDLKNKLEELPGVDTAAPVRYIEVNWIRDNNEEKISFMAVDPESYNTVTKFVFSDSSTNTETAMSEFIKSGNIFISSVISEKYGLKAGDTLKIQTLESQKDFKVAAVILDFFNQGMVVTGNWTDMKSMFNVNDVSTFFIKAAKDFEISETISQIKNKYQEDYQLLIESNKSIRDRADNLMRQAFSMFDVLGILAVMVAALGVMNTLSMSVAERTREIGMLRSMGMTRIQVVRMILAEAGLLGIIGGVLGLGFGILLTRIFLVSMSSMSGYSMDFVLPVKAIWMSIVVALATSQLSALVPAIRAAKTPVLTAIHYE